jgi:hypothetical protein
MWCGCLQANAVTDEPVFMPVAIRACLHDKEAAGRYRPRIAQFVADQWEYIGSVLAGKDPGMRCLG